MSKETAAESPSVPAESANGECPSALLTAALWSAPDAVLVFDAKDRLVYSNKQAEILIGLPKESLQGRRREDCFSVASDAEPALDELADEQTEWEGRLLQKGDRTISVTLKTTRSDTEGADPHLICFVQPNNETSGRNRERLWNEFATQLSSAKRQIDLLDATARLVVDFAGVDHATITLLDEAQRQFVLESEHPKSPTGPLVGECIPVARMPIQETLQPIIINDAEAQAVKQALAAILTEALQVKSCAIIPMVYHGRVIGTLSIDAIGAKKRFSRDEINTFQSIANQLAVAIENNRLLQADEMLHAIYKESSSGLSLEDAASNLIDRLESVLSFTSASVQLITSGRRVLVYGRGFDKDSASPDLLRRLEHDPLISSIIDEGRIKVIPDTRSAPGWKDRAETTSVNSWIGIPISCGEGLAALVTVDHERPGHFAKLSDADLKGLAQIAERSSLEIRDAYLFHAAGRQIKAFSLVSRVAELVGTKLDTADLLRSITREAVETLPCDFCSVLLHETNDQGDFLAVSTVWPPSAQMVSQRVQIPEPSASESAPLPVLDAFLTGNSFNVADAEEECDVHPVASGQVRSLIVEPITIDSRRIGVILAADGGVSSFRESDQLLLRTLARLTASAMERELGWKRLQSIGHRVLDLDIHDVMEEIIAAAEQLTHKDDGVIFLLNDEGTKVTRRFQRKEAEHPEPRLEKGDSISRHILDSDEPIYEVSDICGDERVRPEVRDKYGSMIGVRLSITDRVVGILYLNGKSTGTLTAKERSFLLALADQAAVVIQRTQLSAQLQNAEALYHSLVDHIPAAVFRKNTQSKFTFANQEFCKSLGVESPDEVIGKSDHDFYPGEIADQYVLDDQRAMEETEPITVEETNVLRNTEKEIKVRVFKNRVTDAEGEVVGTQGIFWDVTEEKRASEQYRALVDLSPNAIVVHTAGQITRANKAAASLFGVDSVADVERHNLSEFVDSSTFAQESWISSQQVGERLVTTVRQGAGTNKVEVIMYGRPLPGMQTEQVVFQDVTELNAQRREILHRAKNNLVQTSSIMAMQCAEMPESDGQAALQEAIERIKTMVDIYELLEVDQSPTLKFVDLAEVMRRLIEKVSKAYAISECVSIEHTLKPVRLHIDRVIPCALAVNELLSNSLQHAFPNGRKGRLAVTLDRAADTIVVTVADDGIGLPDDFGTEVDEQQSLGLRLVHNFVKKRLRGQLSFEPNHPGNSKPGNKVRIEFPHKDRAIARA